MHTRDDHANLNPAGVFYRSFLDEERWLEFKTMRDIRQQQRDAACLRGWHPFSWDGPMRGKMALAGLILSVSAAAYWLRGQKANANGDSSLDSRPKG